MSKLESGVKRTVICTGQAYRADFGSTADTKKAVCKWYEVEFIRRRLQHEPIAQFAEQGPDGDGQRYHRSAAA